MNQDNEIEQNPLATVARAQSSTLVTNAQLAIDEISNELMVNLDISVLPEGVFVEYFLDYFMHPENHPDSTLLSKWIELAGGPYNSVNIIDPQGRVLFTAPSAYAPVDMNYDNMNNINFRDIAATYNMNKMITEAQATNYLTSMLSAVNKLISPRIEEHILRWANIFQRYSKPVDSPKKENTTKLASASILDI